MKSPIFKSEFKVFLGLMLVAAVVTLGFIKLAHSEQNQKHTKSETLLEQNTSQLNIEAATKLLLAQYLDVSLNQIQNNLTLKQLGLNESAAAEIILALEDRYEISLFENKGFDLNVTVAKLVHEIEQTKQTVTAGL